MKRRIKYQFKCSKCGQVFSTNSSSAVNEPKYCLNCSVQRKKEIEEKKKAQEKPKTLEGPKLGYKYKLFELSSKSLSQFVFPSNRRRLSGHQISSLKKTLYLGKHFDSPIVVNKVEGMLRVVDGSHRIEAFKHIAKKYKGFTLKILLIVYSNLDEDAEIEAFRRWNVGKVQSTDDFIQSIAHKVPIIRWLKKEFPIPVTVYKAKGTIGIRFLCSALIAAKTKDDTGYGLRRHRFAQDLYKLTEEDYEFLKGWTKNFKDIFGIPTSTTRYYTSTFFTALMYITYESRSDKLWEKMKDKVLGNQEVIEYSMFGGREANRKMIRILKDLLKISSNKLF